MRNADIHMHEQRAGTLLEGDSGYTFSYEAEYLSRADAKPVSASLPLRQEAYLSPVLFPFFDGLIPEGWLLDVAAENWKLDPRDRMGLLLACCRDCIGAVRVLPVNG